MISKKKINLNDSNVSLSMYKTDSGSFFTIDGDNKLHNINKCRELFDNYFTFHTKQIGYVRGTINVENLNNFFAFIETKLKLKDKTIFYKTNRPAVIVSVSNFWRGHRARRQLFTLFVRAGINYYKSDFWETIRSYDLTSNIESLIFHFLKGNTKIKKGYSGDGIVDTFNDADMTRIRGTFINGKNTKLSVSDMVFSHQLPFK